MKKKLQRKRLVLTAIFSLLFCLSLQCVWYYALEGANARFVSPVGEENTLIRMQRLGTLKGNIDTVFMGSSVTERFLSRGRCATVAISHSPYMTGINQMKRNIEFPAGTVYVLETTNMLHPTENEITARMNEWDFRLFKNSPIFSIAAKPINLVVSSIFHVTNSGKKTDETPLDAPVTEPLNLDGIADMTETEVEQYKEFIDGIEELRRMGGVCVFMNYPRVVRAPNFDTNFQIACKIAKHTGVPVLDYHVPYWDERLHFSDGFHFVSRDPLTVRFMNTVARDVHACVENLR